MRLMRLVLCLLILTSLNMPAFAAEEGNADPITALTKAMQSRYETLKTFEAAFTQNMTNAASGETVKRSGTIRFQRPMLIRWETMTPEPELLVIGGQDVWSFFPEEETAYRFTTEQIMDSKTMLRFISGNARLDEDFWVADGGMDDGLRKLQLVPQKPEPSLVEAEMWVDVERAVMTKMTVIDFFGNQNSVALENLKLDVELPEAIFSFTPPEGTDVFDNRQKK